MSKKKAKDKGVHTYYDYSLLVLTLFLIGFGLIMIYSTSSYNATRYMGDPMYYLKRQGFFALIGIPLLLFVSKLDYHLYIKRTPKMGINLLLPLYILCVVLQILVIKFGKEINGAKRWLEIPGVGSFQPSEVTKVCVILLTAYIVYLAPRKLNHFFGFVRVGLFLAPLLILVIVENLSTAIVMGAVFVVICFVASRKKMYYVIVGILGVGFILAYIFLGEGFRGDRVDAWLNVETHEKGYQILQGLYAIASGGMFGKGLGESMQKLGFIPESHNDMIFSVICEELGLVGALAVILLFLLLIWRLFVVAINAPDLYGSLICVGVLTHIAVQVIINIAVVTNSMPSTGIPLPFISYGGSSLLVLMVEMGIALSVSNRITYER